MTLNNDNILDGLERFLDNIDWSNTWKWLRHNWKWVLAFFGGVVVLVIALIVTRPKLSMQRRRRQRGGAAITPQGRRRSAAGGGGRGTRAARKAQGYQAFHSAADADDARSDSEASDEDEGGNSIGGALVLGRVGHREQRETSPLLRTTTTT